MAYLAENWSFDPFLVIVVILVAWHEIGLARLDRHSPPARTRQRRIRSIWFYAGLAVALVSVTSPIGYWAGDYFFIHIIQHLLLMFAAPSLIVAGAPWQPLRHGLPGRPGPGSAPEVMAGGSSRPVRGICGVPSRPWVVIGLFNAVIVLWYVPSLFDLAATNSAVRIWLMHGSYLVAGVLFWLQFIPSAPFRIRLSRLGQLAGLLATNWILWILAMSMSILTNTSWYPIYGHVPGVTFAPFADQQLGAIMLWISGFFWAGPTLNYAFRRMLAEDQGNGVSAAIDKMIGRQ